MAADGSALSCPSCGTEAPRDSRFCPRCGTNLVTGETLELSAEPVVPDRGVSSSPAPQRAPTAVHQSHRRPLGVHPVPLLGGLGSLALLAAIILLASASIVGGLVLLGLAAVFLTLFLTGARREPDAPAAQLTLRTIDRFGSLARCSAVATRAWARAGVDLARIRRRQRRLRGELKRRLGPLGEAVHRDDQRRAEELKRQTAALERELGESQREVSAVIASARHEIDDARTRFALTERLARMKAQDAGPSSSAP